MTDPQSSAKDHRRTALLDAASQLLAVNPTASLAEIAEHAGIGKATLHRYFTGRDDLIIALAYRAIELVSSALNASDPERGAAADALTRAVEALVPLGDRIHFLLSEPVLNAHAEVDETEAEALTPIRQLIARGQASGELRADLPTSWLMHVLSYMLYATWQAVYDGTIPRRDAARLLVTTLFNGIRGEHSPHVQR